MTIDSSLLIPALLIIPLAGIIMCQLRLRPRLGLYVSAAVSVLEAVVVIPMVYEVHVRGELFFAGKFLFVDMLSVFHLMLVSIIFSIAALYAPGYFGKAIEEGSFDRRSSHRFSTLWCTFLFTMVLVLLANDMGMRWIALEATTLASAFLILSKEESTSIEAMWKYLLICSVGIAFALIGTILLSAASRQAFAEGNSSLLWTDLRGVASKFDPHLMLGAFVFAVIGFGTKAGLAPMHTWLPDAHSQAPTPVSAVFSGVMLNCALYCVLRFLPLAEAALPGSGRPRMVLLVFGILSILVAMIFIPAQRDIKRLLAYSSIEHIGIITAGIGLGGFGTVAAFYHIVNHSLTKVLAFISAGRLAQEYGTRDMRRIQGAMSGSPLWGTGFFVAVLILIGVAPFAIFMSELQILKASIDTSRYVVTALFLLGLVVIFVGVLKHAIGVVLGHAAAGRPAVKVAPLDIIIVVALIAVLLFLGLWIPGEYWNFLRRAAGILG